MVRFCLNSFSSSGATAPDHVAKAVLHMEKEYMVQGHTFAICVFKTQRNLFLIIAIANFFVYKGMSEILFRRSSQ